MPKPLRVRGKDLAVPSNASASGLFACEEATKDWSIPMDEGQPSQCILESRSGRGS